LHVEIDGDVISDQDSAGSSAAFHVNPKSFLLMTVLAEATIRTLPHGSFVAGEMLSTSSSTLRVTP
jgi:hypothetical protein